jgi:hypothetical protein
MALYLEANVSPLLQTDFNKIKRTSGLDGNLASCTGEFMCELSLHALVIQRHTIQYKMGPVIQKLRRFEYHIYNYISLYVYLPRRLICAGSKISLSMLTRMRKPAKAFKCNFHPTCSRIMAVEP